MPWKKQPNVAMYKGADWSTLVQQVSGTTPAQARRLAILDPTITFFFYCNEPMVLEATGNNPTRYFNAGDAVFFSGEPWAGDAPQCDIYEKDELTIVYLNPKTPQVLRDVASYQLPDGTPAIDIVSLFGSNYASAELPYLRAENNHPVTTKPLNAALQAALDSDAVKYLQSQGITVLLTVLNGYAPVGWSQFGTSAQDEQHATDFVNYLRDEMVNKYGLDGIDIDDEYSSGKAYDTSLAMVTTLMHQAMPGKIISKALWADRQNFGPTFQGRTLADNLTYGWEMTYYGGPAERLSPYLSLGLQKNQLVLGFSAEEKFSPWSGVAATTAEVVQQGYAGAMLFDFQNQPASLGVMSTIVDALCGPGSWNVANPPA